MCISAYVIVDHYSIQKSGTIKIFTNHLWTLSWLLSSKLWS